MNKIRVCLFGRHALRTPMAYPGYRVLFNHFVQFVDEPYQADVVVLGFSVDMNGLNEKIQKTIEHNPEIKFVVISEEPLWDTLSPNAIDSNIGEWHFSYDSVEYAIFNHSNSRIFDFECIPYFLTTESHYLPRYLRLFASLLKENSAREMLNHWQSLGSEICFVHQQRDHAKYAYSNKALGVYGLSIYRCALESALNNTDSANSSSLVAKVPSRQDLPDWHLDKLMQLEGKTAVLSAIENTVQRNYITEKLFDAYAVGAIPIYFASDSHRVFELVRPEGFINLHGHGIRSAASTLTHFSPDISVAEAYLHNVDALCTRFSSAGNFHQERERVVNEVMHCIRSVMNH